MGVLTDSFNYFGRIWFYEGMEERVKLLFWLTETPGSDHLYHTKQVFFCFTVSQYANGISFYEAIVAVEEEDEINKSCIS